MSLCLGHENHCLLNVTAAKVPMWLYDGRLPLRAVLSMRMEDFLWGPYCLWECCASLSEHQYLVVNFRAVSLKVLHSISAVWLFAAMGHGLWFQNFGIEMTHSCWRTSGIWLVYHIGILFPPLHKLVFMWYTEWHTAERLNNMTWTQTILFKNVFSKLYMSKYFKHTEK